MSKLLVDARRVSRYGSMELRQCPRRRLFTKIRMEIIHYLSQSFMGFDALDIEETLPKALWTQVLTALTSNFGLVALVQ